jgi:hypothetical protein
MEVGERERERERKIEKIDVKIATSVTQELTGSGDLPGNHGGQGRSEDNSFHSKSRQVTSHHPRQS